MKQKIIKVGNSAAVTIPKEYLEKLNVSVGSGISLSLKPKTKQILLDIVQKNQSDELIDTEVFRVATQLKKQYQNALHELAHK